jgi:hypothetical protein
MAEKEGLRQTIKKLATTIDQLTRHLHILQSQNNFNEMPKQELMKTHLSYNINVSAAAKVAAAAVTPEQEDIRS